MCSGFNSNQAEATPDGSVKSPECLITNRCSFCLHPQTSRSILTSLIHLNPMRPELISFSHSLTASLLILLHILTDCFPCCSTMGRIFLDHIGGTRLFSCANCDTILTNRSELISTRFTGATGRAFLFNKVKKHYL